MNNLGVIELRNKFNITQDELAELVGVSRRTIANWEEGRTIPPAMQNVLETIAQKDTITLHNQQRNAQPKDGIFIPQSVVELLLSQQRTIENLSQSVKANHLDNSNKKSGVA